MRAEHINPFVNALQRTFLTMLDCEIHRGALRLKHDPFPGHHVSGIIGLSGTAVGTVVVSFSESLALKAASILLMAEATEIDGDVIDAVGEIANMVAGAAKAQLEEFSLSISLPSVVTGTGYEVRFPSNVQPICIPFDCAWGPMTLEVGLAAVTEAAHA